MRISTRRSDLPEGKSLIAKVRYLGLFVPALLLLMSYQTANAQFSLSVTVQSNYNGEDIRCFGGSSGIAKATPTGGVTPYTYLWSTGQTTQLADGLAAGNYSVTVKDATLATLSGSITLNNPPDFDGAASILVPISCYGMCDGSVTVDVNPAMPGVTPYVYLWGTGETSKTIINACPGYYSVVVTDANDCIIDPNPEVYLSEPSEIQIAAFPNNVSCNGGNNGSISLIVVGGTPPYFYTWNTSATTSSISNLTAGTYTVTIDDTDGCSNTNSFTITQPTAIAITTVSTQDVLCYGVNTGAADISVAGGTSPYTYLWSTGATTQDVSGLSSGTYTVTVTDFKNCQKTGSVTINAATQYSIITDKQDVTCNGNGDGYIHLTVSGGTMPYIFNWSNGATIEDLDNLSGGSYSYTITDNNGCIANATVVVDEASSLVAGITATNVLCFGNMTGMANLTASGGNAPYTYSWTNSATTEDLINVAAGAYQVTVTDLNNCQVTAATFITQPAILVATASATNLQCYHDNSGAVSLVVTGGVASYSYNWSNSSTLGSLNNVAAGTYSVTVTDSNNCTATAEAIVTEPSEFYASITGTNVNCQGNANGAADLSIVGGTPPYSYLWGGGEITEDLTGLSGGTYSVTVTDANNCTAQASVQILEPATLTLSLTQVNILCNGNSTGSINLTISGGNPNFTILWSNGAVTEDLTAIAAGPYSVTVTDANGCVATAGTIITQPALLVATASATNLQCFQDNTGAVSLVVTGGVAPYSYIWSNTSTLGSLNGLAAGTYDVTVSDANGCTANAGATVTQPAILAASIAGTNVNCNGNANGAADLTVTGGTAPYTYLWDGGETIEDLAGLSGGTYNVTITDANNCTAPASVVIVEPAALTLSHTQVNILCNGNSTGSIDLTIVGGTASYTIAWSNLANTEDLSSIPAGPYSVNVTDMNGCVATLGTIVTQPAVLVATASATNLQCYQDNTGAVSLVVTGGVAPYYYSWSNTSTLGSLNGLAAGTYNVTVTDSNGCTANAGATVTQPTLLAATIAGGNVGCFGAGNGHADLTASGGTPPYSYLWTNGETTQNISGLSGGVYGVTVTDANNCTATASTTIIESPQLNLSHTQVNILCNGNSTGSIDLTISGGTPSFTILWSNGAATEDLTAIAAGTYSVTVTDANGCVATLGTIITQPAVLVATASATNLKCFQDNTGAVSLVVTGGVAPYSYSWSNSSTLGSLNGLAAGTYNVTVTDANGCTANAGATVTQPTILAASIAGANVNCNGNANGAADLTVTGGTPAYTYLWNGGEVTEDLTGLSGGTYSVTVTDANNCTAPASVVIVEPAALTLSNTQVNVLCNGNSTGSIDLTIAGGTPSFTILWSNGAATEDLTAIAAGTYSVTVTDANGCVATLGTIITQPAVLVATASATNLKCFQDNTGAVSLVVTGGVAPYYYSWSNGSALGSLNGLAAGTYDVTVTDANGCTANAGATVTQPAILVASIAGGNVGCYGAGNGQADLTPSGGTLPYSYIWTNGAITQDLTGLSGGNYGVTVTDGNNCTATASTTIIEAPELTLSHTQVNILCNGNSTGSIDLTITGGTPSFIISWNDGITTEDRSSLPAGSYSVTVTDANGCVATAGFIITQPALLVATASATNLKCFQDNTGAVSLVVTGGVTPYYYSWSNGSALGSLNGLAAGTYNVTVTDANGCTANAGATVTQPTILAASIAGTNVNCNGNANGAANLSVTGGTPAYSYLWNGGETTEDLTGLSGGTYSVTVTDANNCTAPASVVIAEPATLTLSHTQVNILCNGNSTGSIDLTIAGGTPSFTILWSNGAATEDLTAIAAGSYSVTVTDANGCVATLGTIITQPAVLFATASATDLKCFQDNTGAVSLVVTGGVTPYYYSWSNGSALGSLNGLAAGTYNVTVTDANGCTATAGASVTQPSVLAASIVGADVDCHGSANGTANLSVTGGTPAYTYLWNGGEVTEDLTGLSGGSYNVTVTDANNCTAQASVVIFEPTAITLSLNSPACNGFEISQFGASTGIINTTAGGGTGTLHYLWSNSATTASLSALPAGTYTLTVTDDNNCTKTGSITLDQPPALLITVSSVSNVKCYGGSSGAITISVNGGVPTYSYTWSNGAGTANLTNVPAGTYTLTVTDFCGGIATVTRTITQPLQALTGILIDTDFLCYGDDDGSLYANASGGTSLYTFQWYRQSNMNNMLYSQAGVTESTYDNYGNGLGPDNYCVVIKDANNCVVTRCALIDTVPQIVVTLVDSAEYPIGPGPYKYDVSCYGASDGWLDITVSGGTPFAPAPEYEYNWGNNYATTQNVTGLWAGAWGVHIYDANGCEFVWQKTLKQPAAITTIVQSTHDITCYGDNDGAAQVIATGGAVGTTFSYLWSPGGQTTAAISGLTAGNYCVSVTDNLTGCGVFDAGSGVAFPANWNYGPTGTNHTVLVPTAAVTIDGTPLMIGDYIGVFYLDGTTLGCAGYSKVLGDSTLIVVWGDDNLTPAKDGMDNFEAFTFRLFRPFIGEFVTNNPLNPTTYNNTYDPLTFIDGYFSVVTNLASLDHLPVSSLCIYMDQPDLLTLSAALTHVDCNGNINGAINLTVMGGTAPYTYSWVGPTPFTSAMEDLVGLAAGMYSVTVTDAHGCIATGGWTLTQPLNPLSVSLIGTNVTCNGDGDGAIDATIAGGTAPYSVAWSNAAVTEDISSLIPGMYTINVTDANGCTTSASYTVTEPGVLTATAVITHVVCNGQSNGAVTLTVSGGTLPMSYLWSNGAVTKDISALQAGSYTVTITDDNGCVFTATYVVTEPNALAIVETIPLHSGYAISCNGGSDGAISIVVSGGTAPYTYLWENGATGTSRTGLSALTYSVTVTDAHNCVAIETYTLTQPSPIQFSETHINVDCFGNATGSIDLSATGGVDNFIYSWSNGAATQDISSLIAGTYTVTVTDDNNCQATFSVTITEPSLLVVTETLTHVDCNGNNTGAISLAVTGGTLSYSFLWNDASTLQNRTGLIAGTYAVTVTDAKGCIVMETYILTQPDAVIVNTSMSAVDCFGNSTGSVTATVTGGNAPYDYVWSNGTTNLAAGATDMISNLAAGNYCVTVHDVNGCPTIPTAGATPPWAVPPTNTYVSHTILVPANIPTFAGAPIVSGDYLGVFYNNGTSMVCGGYVQYLGTSTTFSAWGDDPFTPAIDGFTLGDVFVWKIWRQNVGEFDAVATYQAIGGTITDTDQFNNSGFATSGLASLAESPMVNFISCITVTQPTLLTVVANSVPVVCNGDSTDISAVASGGTPPYTYVWNTTQSGSPIVNIAGTYVVTATDANLCTATATVTVADPALLVLAKSQTEVSCFGGSDGTATLTVTGGYTPYAYLWSTGGNTNSISGLIAGTYTVTVTDFGGCIKTESFTITEPGQIVVTTTMTPTTCYGGSNGTATAAVTGGTAPYNYFWSNGATTFNIGNLTAGTYCVTILDANGCPGTSTAGTVVPWTYTNTLLDQTILIPISSLDFGGGPLLPGDYIGVFFDDNGTLTCGGYVEYTGVNTAVPAYGDDTQTTPSVKDGFDLNESFAWKVWRPNLGEFDAVASYNAIDGILFTAGGSYIGTGETSGLQTLTVDLGSVAVSCVLVTEPTEVTITGTLSTFAGGWNISCFGYSDGSISLNVTGGTGPYAYGWSTGASTPNVNNLTAGTYTVTVADIYGCLQTASFTLVEPAQLVATAYITSWYDVTGNGNFYNTHCNGADGSAYVEVTGGTPTYSYLWAPGGMTDDSLTTMVAGTYYADVLDVNGCTAQSNTITLTSPGPYNVVATQIDSLSCYGDCDASINVTWSGGIPPFDVYWSNWSGAPIIDTATHSLTFPYCYCPLPNCSHPGFCAGTYWAVVVDSMGCAVLTNQVTVVQPDPIVLAPGLTNVSCNGLSDAFIDLSQTTGGVTPYVFVWDASTNYATTDMLTGLSAGDSHYVMAWDGNNCAFGEQFDVTEPALLVINSAVGSNVLCTGATGTITVTATGGTAPYNYFVDGNLVGSSNVITGLAAGTYNVQVKDAHACESNIMSVTISATPSPALALDGIVNVLCNGGNNGAINITVSSGTAPFTYIWSNGATIEDVSGLMAGTYGVTITDSNGCTADGSYTVTEPAVLTLSGTVTNVMCFGASTGSISATVAGGTMPYSYSWLSGSAVNSNLAAGVYNLTVSDANGCTVTGSYTVTQPTQLTLTGVVANVTCNGAMTGAINLFASGGTGTITFLWSNGATSEDISALAAGTYYVVATDANACTAQANFTVTEPSAVSVLPTVVDASCFGYSDGSVTVSVTGGVMPYNYNWSNGGNTAAITGLSAGVYDLTVITVNGCISTYSYTVGEPALLVVTGIPTDVTCPAGNDGAIDATITGGTMPYTVDWNSGFASTVDLTALVSGAYHIDVIDAHGCTAFADFTLSEPAPFMVTDNITNVSCFGGSDGEIALSVSGATGPYTYTWSTGSGATNSGLAAGSYDVTVYDANMCEYTNTYTVNEPAAVSATFIVTDVSCNGLSDGAIEVIAAGGTAPYTYTWSTGSGAINTGLAADNYGLTVTDDNGCTFTAMVQVTEPGLLTASVTPFDTDCNLSIGSIYVNSISGGTAPFTAEWSTGDLGLVLLNVPNGTYELTITDDNSCTFTGSYYVGISNAMSIAYSSFEPTCNGGSDGSIDISVAGGNGTYTYNWMPGGSTDEDINGLMAGTYDVTATDSNGCIAIESITIDEPTSVTASVSTSDETCFGAADGTAMVTPGGGTPPYAYAWLGGSSTGLAPGMYDVTVSDANACSVVVPFEIFAATQIQLTLVADSVQCNQDTDGAIDLTVSGGTSPYLFLWDDPAHSTTQNLMNLGAGTYSVIVEDANGCQVTGSTTVGIIDPFVIISDPVTHVNCNGGSDGSVYVEMLGGHFWFEWTDVLGNVVGTTNNSTNTLLNNVPAGMYYLQITLPLYSNCVMNVSYEVTQPDEIVLTTVVTHAQCYKTATGAVDLTVAGGTPPYAYQWTIGASVITTNQDLVNRKAGIYKVVVTDAHGCSAFKIVTISQPTNMVNTIASTGVTCNGDSDGSIMVTSIGGTAPYSYNWMGGMIGSSLTNLGGGTYTVSISDANNCISVKTADVHEPLPLSVLVTPTDLSCNGSDDGEATADVVGGTFPYNFSWNTGSSNEDIENLSAGMYTVTVIDDHGCPFITSTNVNEPAILAVTITSVGGTATATATGGTTAYSYVWSNGIVGPSTPLPTPPYSITVTVTDAHGCTAQATISSPAPPASSYAGNDQGSDNDAPFVSKFNNLEGAVTIYPNPSADGYFVVQFDNIDLENAQLHIVDGFGKVVNNKMVVDPITRQVELKLEVAKGVYYLKIITKDHGIVTKPLVITE
ncbi:MAG: T9SS type A sorting domain-containing protein [Bacteroidales bacterium]|nr:T9SS type A sorting domain-containing protein [Bacteroidales bacterium]MCF8455934.1 T9SS type A sorting domain-containing protein [Bacteroidales bacterium]